MLISALVFGETWIFDCFGDVEILDFFIKLGIFVCLGEVGKGIWFKEVGIFVFYFFIYYFGLIF